MEKLRLKGIWFIGGILLIGVWYYREKFFAIAEPFGWGIVIAALLMPIAGKLEEKFSLRASVGIIYGSLAFLIFLLLWFGIPVLTSGIKSFVDTLPELRMKIQMFLEKLPFEIKYAENEVPFVNNIDFMGSLTSWIDGITAFLIGIVLSAYFLIDRRKMGEEAFELLPERFRGEAKETFAEITDMFGRFIRGRFLLSVAIGVLTFIMIIAFGLPYALVLSLLAAFLDILPFFGPFLAGVPIVLLAMTESVGKGIATALSIVAIQQIESLFLTPKIMGDSVGLHPAVTILAVLTGASFFGVFGMILAVPVFAGMKILIKHIFSHIV